MPSTRQTVTYLQRRFQEAGIRPEVRHGQNFLIDLNLLDLLLETAAPTENDVMLEIGTGMGSLTSMLADHAAHVVTVEIDARMHQLASEELENYGNITLLQQDALRNKNHLADSVLDEVRKHITPGRQFKLAANLPYNVATPILSNLLMVEPTPVSLTATIQKELADRMVAPPGVKDYSALSVWMQSLCDLQITRILPPQVFWPRPKVHSAIVHIVPNAAKRALIPDLEFFHTFVRGLFLHRRKFLRSGLVAAQQEHLDKPAVDEVLAPFAFPVDVRAEQLPLETIQQLSEAFRQRRAS
ncbi:16S rRNA (adenine(1518)-N(6)/adenine(1519)-N(6))-dimethyltransferase RsmA [Anatilimnocola floriformis]|uniref:16S rRNA (adenine(1518)-N(6)/adenine(1519)-N(6))- dimethyltransferase RsmA n=1 Tax=Anatilimnocola floriformis TaxID=2948575 RepID=UPI0020C32A84|nr:16S rRNA (adenine(1518)-N(6)/adenine(1519)-N(6))-dimethyltransferase RsmA [Anatilimnocola floriformis]